VQPTTGTREIVSVTVNGLCLRGVHHKAGPGPVGGDHSQRRTGVLLLNHGFLPKSAPGDSAVFWADALAGAGYPCFRLDLPGLGDSDGAIAMPMLEFVNAGGYAPYLSAAVKQLVEGFALAGMVVVGHCASSVTALFTAAQTKECMGLVLTDPYFFRVTERTEVLRKMGRWASWSRIGSFVRRLYVHCKHIPLLFRRGQLPKNANWELLACWRQLNSHGAPILILKAPTLAAEGFKARTGEFDYLAYLQTHASPQSRTVLRYIEGTNHSFADPVGRRAVLAEMEHWLDSFFPLAVPAGSNPSLSTTYVHTI
jgi:pimeloyl-ACP methyl ester carboxylesterase